MTLMEVLASRVTLEIPAAETSIDEPIDKNNGTWHLDITSRNRHIVVEWKKGHSFKLYDLSDALTPHAFGDEPAPEEVCEDIDQAFQAILNLLTTDLVK